MRHRFAQSVVLLIFGLGLSVGSDALLTLDAQGAVEALNVSRSLAAQTPSQSARPNLIIQGNTITDSGYGIYVGPAKDWENALIKGNTITNNGDGIYIVNRGIQILANQIQGNIVGVKLNDTIAGPGGLEQLANKVGPIYLGFNDISGNREYGLLNLTVAQIEARQNWWGSAAGPAEPHPPQTAPLPTEAVTFTLMRLDGGVSTIAGALGYLVAGDGVSQLAGLSLPALSATLQYTEVPDNYRDELYSRYATVAVLIPPRYVTVVSWIKPAVELPTAGDFVKGKVDASHWASAPVAKSPPGNKK